MGKYTTQYKPTSLSYTKKYFIWVAFLGWFFFLFGAGCGKKRSSFDCKIASDCKKSQHCVEKQCLNVCKSDKDCPTGNYCDLRLSVCRKGSPKTSAWCGDGVVVTGEECDRKNLNGQSCNSQGFESGTLSCTSGCRYDTSACKKSSSCGNGVIESGEQCDGSSLNSGSCKGLGYTGGSLLCSSSCRYDTSACKKALSCGNGIVDHGESCDGSELNNQSCSTQGFDSGSLACTGACRFDTSNCKRKNIPTCGNGKVDVGEDCDGQNLSSQSCQTRGFSSGSLRCTNACQIDASACKKSSSCGNGKIDSGESCDGSAFSGKDCRSQGFDSGTLRCTAGCQLDTSACKKSPKCGNGKIDPGEICDGGNLKGKSCRTEGFDSGTLRCTSGCRLNTSGCKKAPKTCKPACSGSFVCDRSNFSCVQCLQDSDCRNQVCYNKHCVMCKSNQECTSASSSKCSSHRCSKCRSDSDCSHISGRPSCISGACQKKTKCEDWDNNRKAPCPRGTKNCDCSGGCGSATSCGGGPGPGTGTGGCYTVRNTSARSAVPASSGGHGSHAFLWKPVADSTKKLVVLFPSKLAANKGWVQRPNGSKEYSYRVVRSNPNRQTHFFRSPGSSYPNGSKACWSSK